MKEIRNNIDVIQEKGADLLDITHNIDTSTSSGKFLIPFFSMLAEIDQVLRKERTAAGWEIAKREGRTGGRKAGLSNEAKKKLSRLKKCICLENLCIQQEKSALSCIFQLEHYINIYVIQG